MARLDYVDPTLAPAPVRDALARLPVKLNIFRMLANADTLFRPFLRLGSAILGDMAIDARARELVILHVGRQSRAEYEWVQHVPIAEAVGISKAEIAALEREDIESECFDARDKALLRFTTEVLHEVKASDAAFAAAREHFSPREICELILTIGYYMTIARFAETTGLEVDGPAGTAIVKAARR